MNYDKLTNAEALKLQAIEQKLKRLNAEIIKMGFNVYLANSTINIMKGDHHDERADPLPENAVHSFILRGWDGGDW